MPHQEGLYDGTCESMHTVKRGESLSTIASQYKFKSWQPIWIYNTQVKHMLDARGNPGKIEVGQHLFIPRSKEGYDKLLRKLEALKEGLAASGESQMYELEAIEYQYKARAVLFDFAGDVATMLGSLGAKAFEVARLREGAAGLKGAQRFAHEIKLKQAMEDLAEAASKKELGKAAAGAAANSMGVDDTAATFGLKTVPKLAKAGAALRSRMKLGPALRAVKGTSSILDIADIALDYIKVSTVANAFLKLTLGETVEGSLDNARAYVKANICRGLVNLHQKAQQIQKQRDLLYPTGSGIAEAAAEGRT